MRQNTTIFVSFQFIRMLQLFGAQQVTTNTTICVFDKNVQAILGARQDAANTTISVSFLLAVFVSVQDTTE